MCFTHGDVSKPTVSFAICGGMNTQLYQLFLGPRLGTVGFDEITRIILLNDTEVF